MTMTRWLAGGMCLAFAAAAPAEAQFLEAFEEDRWGVHASFTPQWRAPEQIRHLLGSDYSLGFDWEGSDWSIGFVRGRANRGEWGLALIRQQVKPGSTICLGAGEGDACASLVEAGDDLRMQGFEFHWFTPVASVIEDRLQFGINVGAGAGWYEGPVRWAVSGRPNVMADAADLLRLGGPDGRAIPIPLFRIEFGVGGMVAPGLRVMGSGGWGLPGSRRIGLAVSYYPGS